MNLNTFKCFFPYVGWLFFGLNDPLRQYFSLYRSFHMTVSSVYVPVRPSVCPNVCMPRSNKVCLSVCSVNCFLCVNVCLILACVLECLCASLKFFFSLSFYLIVCPPVSFYVFINLCVCSCPDDWTHERKAT